MAGTARGRGITNPGRIRDLCGRWGDDGRGQAWRDDGANNWKKADEQREGQDGRVRGTNTLCHEARAPGSRLAAGTRKVPGDRGEQ